MTFRPEMVAGLNVTATCAPAGKTNIGVFDGLAAAFTHWALSHMSRSWKAEPLFIDDGTIRRAPEFSPDGKWLAYMSGPSNTVQDIYVEPFPRTGQVIRVTRNGGFWPFWSKKKGDRLFFRSVSSAVGNRLRVVDVETKPGFRFSNESLVNVMGFNIVTYYRDYDPTPDDRKLLMVFPVINDSTDEGVIHVVLNWTEELKRLVATGQ